MLSEDSGKKRPMNLAGIQGRLRYGVIAVPELGECWVWTGALNQWGYGVVRWDGNNWLVHRLMAALHGVVLDPELEMDHLCRVRACCRPSHLEQVTRRTNQLRGYGPAGEHARQEMCQHGHPFDYVDSRGRRVCRTCRNLAKAKARSAGPGRRYGAPTCKYGHPWDYVNSRGERVCRTCGNERNARSRARKRG